MVMGTQGLQSQKICSRVHNRSRTLAIPDDGGAVVMSHCSNGELRRTVMCSNHVVMCYSSHEFQITVCDSSLWVGKGDQGVLCPLFVGLMPQIRSIVRLVWC